jgi:hypothetical protein
MEADTVGRTVGSGARADEGSMPSIRPTGVDAERTKVPFC